VLRLESDGQSRDTAATPEVAIFAVNDAEAKFAVNMKGFTQAWPSW